MEFGCLEISATSGRSAPLGFWIFLSRVGIYQGGSSSPDTSNYRTTKAIRPDRKWKLERDCLEISVSFGHPSPFGIGILLVCGIIYQESSVSPDASNYTPPEEDRPRSTSDTGARLPGNISYVGSNRVVSFRGSPQLRKHLAGRFCFSRYVEL